jgi:hypothetical protein
VITRWQLINIIIIYKSAVGYKVFYNVLAGSRTCRLTSVMRSPPVRSRWPCYRSAGHRLFSLSMTFSRGRCCSNGLECDSKFVRCMLFEGRSHHWEPAFAFREETNGCSHNFGSILFISSLKWLRADMTYTLEADTGRCRLVSFDKFFSTRSPSHPPITAAFPVVITSNACSNDFPNVKKVKVKEFRNRPGGIFPFHTCIRQWEAELCLRTNS